MSARIEVFEGQWSWTTQQGWRTPAQRPHGARIVAGNGRNIGRVGNELYSTRSNAVRAAREEAKVRGCVVMLVDTRGEFVKYL